jgi:hypothetical protein
LYRWKVRLELRGSKSGHVTDTVLSHLAEELGHLNPRFMHTHSRVVLEVAVVSDGADSACTYARQRVVASLVAAGVEGWQATVVDADLADDELDGH